MAKTYETLVYEARELLKDTDADVRRFPDSTMLNILNRGLHDMARIRPDACYDIYADNSLNVVEVTDAAPGAGQVAWTDTFGLDMMFYSPLVSYLVGVAEVTDDEYTVDGRAALMLSQFRNTVIGL